MFVLTNWEVMMVWMSGMMAAASYFALKEKDYYYMLLWFVFAGLVLYAALKI